MLKLVFKTNNRRVVENTRTWFISSSVPVPVPVIAVTAITDVCMQVPITGS